MHKKIEVGRDKKWYPMREFQGKDRNGNKVTKEVFRNIETGDVYYPESKDGEYLGWNGEPPVVEGAKIFLTSKQYSKNYERIFGHP